MTEDEVIVRARSVAQSEAWPWAGPAEVSWGRKSLPFGPLTWLVVTNGG